jgi:hypothetical protein
VYETYPGVPWIGKDINKSTTTRLSNRKTLRNLRFYFVSQKPDHQQDYFSKFSSRGYFPKLKIYKWTKKEVSFLTMEAGGGDTPDFGAEGSRLGLKQDTILGLLSIRDVILLN